MALCRVTGTLYVPSGEPAAGYSVYLTRESAVVVPEYLGSVVPDSIRVQAGWNGEVNFEVLSGTYSGVAGSSCGGKGFTFNFVVPDADNALFQDCLDAVVPDPPPPAWLQRIENDVARAEAAATSVEEALTGGPWQVVATNDMTGKAEARDLTFSSVVDLDLFGAVPNFAFIPYYYIKEDGTGAVEEKAAPITATAMDSVSTVAVRSPAGEIEVQARPSSGQLVAVNKKYLAEEFRPIRAMLAMNYPVGVANPPTATPENHTALLPGAEARHTNPGGNRGGGIAFGVSAKINGLHHIAVGPLIEVGPRNAQDVYDLTLTGTMHSVAVGGASVVSVNNGTALGARAKVKHANSVALGSDAETDAIDTVSVGSATQKRRITNTADPTSAQDAATKAYVDRTLSPAQRAAITALTPIADPATATVEGVATLLNSIIAALKA